MTEPEALTKECRIGGPIVVDRTYTPPRVEWPLCSASRCGHWRFIYRSTTDGHCAVGGKRD